MIQNLPPEYTAKMRDLLGDEYEAYAEAIEQPSCPGLRINTSKISVDDFVKRSPFNLEPVPWCPNGFYYDPVSDRPSAHPWYHCGLYYIQEPSAMAPASFLQIKPGDRVLDLCAAPGEKTTQLALAVRERGLLVSNDISASRAKALVKNIELFGLKNVVVTCESPQKLAECFPEYFDKILVDAPCSGEGMFRKGSRMIRAWSEHGPSYFAPVQKEITAEALRMLKPGGQILYSTCTFDPSEDEQTVEHMIRLCPELNILDLPHCEGFVPGFSRFTGSDIKGIGKTVRLFPHRIRGEGHFVALLQKGSPEKDAYHETEELKENVIIRRETGRGKAAKTLRMEIPGETADMKGIYFKRSGLILGEEKASRFIPGQAYAMTLRKGDWDIELDLTCEDERAVRYLKGESLLINEDDGLPDRGTVLILIGGFPAGWGQISGSRIKNNLLAGWRMQA